MTKKDDNPFASLATLRDALPPGPTEKPEKAPSPFPNKIVIRKERAGRGGKTVTIVEGLPQKMLDDLAREMKKALGCGATVEGAHIALQGEHEERAKAFLVKKGATQVVLGTKRA